ncbi:MAG: hypothetical protein ACLPSW_04170, partial [Roseiarcus sp.]
GTPGRDHSVPVGGIISLWWAASFRYGGRHHLVIVGDIDRNQQLSRRRPSPGEAIETATPTDGGGGRRKNRGRAGAEKPVKTPLAEQGLFIR